jgi:hypothetical protein
MKLDAVVALVLTLLIAIPASGRRLGADRSPSISWCQPGPVVAPIRWPG